jgi:Icc-related predicted phosphoesterase
MPRCLFVSDLHGQEQRYEKLLSILSHNPPDCLFMGGDLLPGSLPSGMNYLTFLDQYLVPRLDRIRSILGAGYPEIFMILGNDDGRAVEPKIKLLQKEGYWRYIHNYQVDWSGHTVYGYSFIPPTPFLLKDWERYDVSRYVDPGCVSPEQGQYSVQTNMLDVKYSTISEDLKTLTKGDPQDQAIWLFHTPPHNTCLDRAALDDQFFEHVPLDVHVGSMAVKRFIEKRQPLIALHGHIHESTRLTGSWRQIIGRTHCFNAAHDGPELSVIEFDSNHPASAVRNLH